MPYVNEVNNHAGTYLWVRPTNNPWACEGVLVEAKVKGNVKFMPSLDVVFYVKACRGIRKKPALKLNMMYFSASRSRYGIIFSGFNTLNEFYAEQGLS